MELLPCPFCGGEALPTAHLTYNWFAPVCRRCNARGPSVKIERDSDPQEMRNLMNQADENWNRRASPASVPEGFTMSEPAILPDGSGFGTMSFPLPKNHWIYKEREYEDGAIEPNDLPAPVLTHSFRRQVIAAIRYAIRSATNCGKEDDFDPDALVQNAVYALCGPYGKAAPTPPAEDRNDAERFREGWTHACNALCMEIALWIERCPHCGMPAPKAPTMQEDKKP